MYRKKPAPVKSPETIEVRPPGGFDHNGHRIATVNGHHNKPSTDVPMSYSRLSLESAAAAAAANSCQQPIRHHPNGLVTFCPNNGSHNGSVNGAVANGSVHAHSNGNGHVGNGYVANGQAPNGHGPNGHVHNVHGNGHVPNGGPNGHVTGHGGGMPSNGGHRVHKNHNGNGSVNNSKSINNGQDHEHAPQHNINHHVHQLRPRSNDPNQVIVIV